MRIVVLTKPVPDPASGGEHLGPDDRLAREGLPAVINGNDEYALEAALKLADAGAADVTLLAMAPPAGAEVLRKGLAMGAHRAVHVSDEALAGSCSLSTARVLAAALRGLEYDLVFAGADTSDGGGGTLGPAIATLLGLPYLGYAALIEPDEAAGRVRVRRLSAVGHDVIEAPMPAVVGCTQLLGEPRYPSLKGIMGARSKEIVTRSLEDLELGPEPVGGEVSTTRVRSTAPPEARGATRVVRGSGPEAAAAIVDFLVERRVI